LTKLSWAAVYQRFYADISGDILRHGRLSSWRLALVPPLASGSRNWRSRPYLVRNGCAPTDIGHMHKLSLNYSDDHACMPAEGLMFLGRRAQWEPGGICLFISAAGFPSLFFYPLGYNALCVLLAYKHVGCQLRSPQCRIHRPDFWGGDSSAEMLSSPKCRISGSWAGSAIDRRPRYF